MSFNPAGVHNIFDRLNSKFYQLKETKYELFWMYYETILLRFRKDNDYFTVIGIIENSLRKFNITFEISFHEFTK